MKPWRALDAYWYAPAPANRLALLRIGIGGFALGYLLLRYFDFVSVTRFHDAEFQPVAPLLWLAGPLPPLLLHGLLWLAFALGSAVTLGVRYRVTAPLFAALLLGLTSYRNSWGMLFHTENLLVLHVLLLAFTPAADALSWDARNTDPPSDAGDYGWPARALCLITVACYVMAGIAKLKLAGVAWFEGDFLRAQIAYDNLRKVELGSDHSPLGAAIVRYRWPFGTLAFITMLVELGAPLALLGQRWASVWIVGAWGFHVAILLLMAIVFPYQLSLIAYAAFLPLERLLTLPLAERWLARLRRPKLTSS